MGVSEICGWSANTSTIVAQVIAGELSIDHALDLDIDMRILGV